MGLKLAVLAIGTLSCVLACSDGGSVEAPENVGGSQQVGGNGALGGSESPSGAGRTETGKPAAGEGGTAPVAAAGKSGAGEAPSAGGETSGAAGMPPISSDGGGPPGPNGVQVYALNCAKCHGADGRGGMFAPEIVHPVREYASWVARNGRPYTKMPSFAKSDLSDAELAAIFDYLDTPPQAATGHGLFLDYCGNCHGDDGVDTTKQVAEIVDQVRHGANAGKFYDRQHTMPAFSKERLSDAQLQLITGYLLSL